MQHRFVRPVAGLALGLGLLTATAAWADSVRVGDAAADKNRAADAIDFAKWSGCAPREANSSDINQPVRAKLWTVAEITSAKAELNAYINGSPDPTGDRARVRALLARNPSPLGDDLHPVWYTEWLKLQPDVAAQFVKPPPNKILIVDQDRLSKMSDAEKKNLKVQYRKTTVCEKVISYKPIYKTIEVAYPG